MATPGRVLEKFVPERIWSDLAALYTDVLQRPR
jgi:hypothetical protein